MLRVTTGHYRDVCMNKVYDVMRVNNAQCGKGWQWHIHNAPIGLAQGLVYDTKEDCARACRRAIAQLVVELNTL
jgi:hypothetical protein